MPTCTLENTIADARDRTSSAGVEVCVVVNDAGIVLGLLRAEQLDGEGSSRVEDVMIPGPSTFRPHVPIAEMVSYMSKHDKDDVPVTTSEGKLIGVLFREDAQRRASEADG